MRRYIWLAARNRQIVKRIYLPMRGRQLHTVWGFSATLSAYASWLDEIEVLPGSPHASRATTASGVKVRQHPKGLTLMPVPDGGARWREGDYCAVWGS
jgi:hypothetical protein